MKQLIAGVCITGLSLSLYGCIAVAPCNRPRPPQAVKAPAPVQQAPPVTRTVPAPSANTYQYVPEYSDPMDWLLAPSTTPPLQGPMFGMPPATAPGLEVQPFIGPNGVLFCNEAAGVKVCQ